jgi:hypothetical protein
MPFGGYVPENGISLCAGGNGASCHEKAEEAYMVPFDHPDLTGYYPDDLYELIGSSKEKAVENSEKLSDFTN